jgi:hypothetical protein
VAALLAGLAGVLPGGPDPAGADGGAVCVKADVAPFTVPLRAGPVDVSVMVQDLASGTPILDAEVELRLTRTGGGDAALHVPALRASATNKLLYAAVFDLPAAGSWAVRAGVRRGDTTGEVACTVDAAERTPAPIAFWPYFALPPVVIVLFLLHQRLRAR